MYGGERASGRGTRRTRTRVTIYRLNLSAMRRNDVIQPHRADARSLLDQRRESPTRARIVLGWCRRLLVLRRPRPPERLLLMLLLSMVCSLKLGMRLMVLLLMLLRLDITRRRRRNDMYGRKRACPVLLRMMLLRLVHRVLRLSLLMMRMQLHPARHWRRTLQYSALRKYPTLRHAVARTLLVKRVALRSRDRVP